jgi:hypothetical protein
MSAENQTADDDLFFQAVLEACKAHVIAAVGRVVPEVPEAADLAVLAARSADRGGLADGWTTDAPFPGRAAPPAPYPGGWMLAAAVNVTRDSRVLGYLMTTLATGRAPAVVGMRGLKFDVPADWKPIVGAGG